MYIMLISRSVLIGMRMFQTNVAERIKTHNFMSINVLPVNRAVYEMMWKNVVEPDGPQMTIRRMRFASWIPKAINTHSEYEIPIAFP